MHTLPKLAQAQKPSSEQGQHESGRVRLADLGDVLFMTELAALLGTSCRTIRRHLRAVTFPIEKLEAIDKRVRFSKAEVERFLLRQGSANKATYDKMTAWRAEHTSAGLPCRER